jgi:hypothetical protein
MNAIIALRVHSKIHNHYIGRLKLKIINKVKYLNLDVDLIAKNEYGKKKARISPFKLQNSINITKKIKVTQYQYK